MKVIVDWVIEVVGIKRGDRRYIFWKFLYLEGR